jgi:DNA invertase Pin-like site-specific DNA recombinase/DNA-directed RNA polymerase subunit RPC12/RpoP
MTAYIIYSRKSLEDDDSQVQSIPDQEREMKSIAGKLNLTTIEPLSEAKSAKAPGRPVFDEMMKRVDRGEIQGILCWKLDRLARNPVDGGRIIWAIKQHGLVVRTPQQTFSQAEDNLILMYIEFGMAQKYVDDLSRNTRRGLKSKAEKGWFPGVAPIGYLNSKIEERGHKTIYRDLERFDAVRRMWDLMLTGNFSPARIQKIANDEWGFRTRQTKRTGGKPLSRSTAYKIFSDPFYCGRYEYPKKSGQWYHGVHEPMITEAEFSCVQKILHQESNPRPQKEFTFPFRGLIRCGECGSSITGHYKEQIRCTQCGYKSSVKNRDSCSSCRLPISEMRTPKRRRYVYYHCTRTLNSRCRQKSVSASALEKQLRAKLPEFGLPPELSEWGMKYIEKLRNDALDGQRQILEERKKAYQQCVTRLENLVKLKTAAENADSSLLSDKEYQKQRTDLLTQKSRLAITASSFQMELEGKTRRMKGALGLAATIDEASLKDDSHRKKEILSALGLNHALKEKELEIKPEFPFSELPRGGNHARNNWHPIEPKDSHTRQGPIGHFVSPRPSLERDSDEDRTKTLKRALEVIWKKMDLSLPIFKRYPFTTDLPVYRPRRRRGRFVSPTDST